MVLAAASGPTVRVDYTCKCVFGRAAWRLSRPRCWQQWFEKHKERLATALACPTKNPPRATDGHMTNSSKGIDLGTTRAAGPGRHGRAERRNGPVTRDERQDRDDRRVIGASSLRCVIRHRGAGHSPFDVLCPFCRPLPIWYDESSADLWRAATEHSVRACCDAKFDTPFRQFISCKSLLSIARMVE